MLHGRVLRARIAFTRVSAKVTSTYRRGLAPSLDSRRVDVHRYVSPNAAWGDWDREFRAKGARHQAGGRRTRDVPVGRHAEDQF